VKTTASPKHLIFDFAEWSEWRSAWEGDRAKRSMLKFLERHARLCTVTRFTEASTKKRGRKTVWTDWNILYAWVALESELLLAQRTSNRGKVKAAPVFKRLFSRGKHLEVVDGVKIKEHGTARRLYARAKLMMKDNPRLETIWRRHAERGAAAEWAARKKAR
jgi:hypothetical protein